MNNFLIKNANVVLLDRVAERQDVLCCDGKILRVANTNELQIDSTVEIIDAAGKYLAAGFIDLHIHGLGDYLIDKDLADLEAICKLLPSYGVTGFLPSVCPRPKGEDSDFLQALATVKSEGAHIFGFHLEGPFLTMTGALPPGAIGKSDIDRVRSLIKAAEPYPAIFSIAPDFIDIEALLPIMAAKNTPVFMTHTKADVKQTQAAIEAGACHATHFYDVFPNPPQTEAGVRPCGAVEAILADANVSVDFILDGEHVDPVAVEMALRCKGPDRVCLITDANIGAGMKPGRYKTPVGGEIEFTYPGGPARIIGNSDSAGCLAGSGLTMDRAVKNAIKLLDIDLPLAIRMASANPAQVLGLQNRKGTIEANYDADLVLLNKNLVIEQTFVAGKCCYKK